MASVLCPTIAIAADLATPMRLEIPDRGPPEVVRNPARAAGRLAGASPDSPKVADTFAVSVKHERHDSVLFRLQAVMFGLLRLQKRLKRCRERVTPPFPVFRGAWVQSNNPSLPVDLMLLTRSGRTSLFIRHPVKYVNSIAGRRRSGRLAWTAANCSGSKNPRRTLFSASMSIVGFECSLRCLTASENIRFRSASSRLIVAFFAPCVCRAATYATASDEPIDRRRLPRKKGSRCNVIRRFASP